MSKVVKQEVNWALFGEPSQFMPEPSNVNQVMRLKTLDPTAFKAWSIGTRIEVKTLIDKNTFIIEDPKNNEVVIPTTLKCKLKFK